MRIDTQDKSHHFLSNILDGAPIRSVPSFDDRTRFLEFDTFENSNTIFSGMISEFRTYVGLNKKLDITDIDVASVGNLSVHVDALNVDVLSGGNVRLKVTLLYHLI